MNKLEEQIYNYIKGSKDNLDSLDIVNHFNNEDPMDILSALSSLQDKNMITRIYSGIRAYYKIVP